MLTITEHQVCLAKSSGCPLLAESPSGPSLTVPRVPPGPRSPQARPSGFRRCLVCLGLNRTGKQNVDFDMICDQNFFFCRLYRQHLFRITQISIRYSMHLFKTIFTRAVLGLLQSGIVLSS